MDLPSTLISLNPDQKRAVEHFEGAAIVLSGPGSGKTRVITHRIVHLIKKRGIAPAKILAVTFTNKAANEMRGRVLTLLGPKNSLPTMGTFHSIGARILREDGESVGLGTAFVIFDEADSFSLVKEVMRDLNIDPKQFSPGSVKAAIESAKNEMVDEKDYAGLSRGFFQEEVVSKVYAVYQQRLATQRAADFDDLLFKTVTLFKKYPEILSKYQTRWEFLLVDEYQDTNKSQYELTKLLAGKTRNIFIVGDASQAIYGWRGADFLSID